MSLKIAQIRVDHLYSTRNGSDMDLKSPEPERTQANLSSKKRSGSCGGMKMERPLQGSGNEEGRQQNKQRQQHE